MSFLAAGLFNSFTTFEAMALRCTPIVSFFSFFPMVKGILRSRQTIHAKTRELIRNFFLAA